MNFSYGLLWCFPLLVPPWCLLLFVLDNRSNRVCGYHRFSDRRVSFCFCCLIYGSGDQKASVIRFIGHLPLVLSSQCISTRLSVMMAAIAGGIGSLVLLYSVKYMAGEEGLTRYYALVLLFIGSMIGLFLSITSWSCISSGKRSACARMH